MSKELLTSNNLVKPCVAIIGGTSLTHFTGLEIVSVHDIKTPYGPTSEKIILGRLRGVPCYFLNRHGREGCIAPHKINYRANIWALHELGVEKALAVTSVGAISDFPPGSLVLPSQIIDYTNREPSFYDGVYRTDLEHIDFTDPFSSEIALGLKRAAEACTLEIADGGVYGVTQGPRLETSAEIKRMRRDGCDLVGMTAMPESSLARELSIEYGNVSLVVNPAAGCSARPLNISEIRNIISQSQIKIIDLIGSWLSKIISN